MKTLKEAHTYRRGSFCQPGKREREKAGGKNLKIHWEFFVFENVLTPCITELGKSGGGKTVCYVSWRNPFHIFVLLFTGLSKKGNSISLSCVDAHL